MRTRRAFYEYHAALMEPWDGPAAIAFTDGRQIGATLDRNGLRPARYLVTDDDLVVMASEIGRAADPGREDRQASGACSPARCCWSTSNRAASSTTTRSRRSSPTRHPYASGSTRTQIMLEELPDAPTEAHALATTCRCSIASRRSATRRKTSSILMTPMASTGEEAVGSMGNDTPISALSDKPKPLFTYFKQNFAQVTNPPIDPIREELVMCLVSIIGPRPNLLDLRGHGRAPSGSKCASRS